MSYDNWKLATPDSYFEEAETEKCHCSDCDVEFDLDELVRVRIGKFFNYLCSECINENK